MLEQDRITPSKALELVGSTGYSLIQNKYIDYPNATCCAVGLPAIARMGGKAFNLLSERYRDNVGLPFMQIISEKTNLDIKYLKGLDQGFEGWIRKLDSSDDEWTLKGFEDGVELRCAVVRGELPGDIHRHDSNDDKVAACIDNVVYGVVRGATPTAMFTDEIEEVQKGQAQERETDPAWIEGYHQTGALN